MSTIDGVKIKQLAVHRDIPDREDSNVEPGFLMEVLRDDDTLLTRFGQTTFTVAYKDTIKAFHWHQNQDDLWFIASGKAVVVLHDMRENSDTFRVTQVISAGTDDYKLILIPIGVAHGYKVISEEPVLLFYHTTESYSQDSPDEERVPWDDPKIGFDWESLQ
ncbi:MAG: dTDP-4-dehydrorhamnose 3,5-epimerase family protein [Candidatus Marinimicrobia bacterium]|jgi:dTDP-4-dehydrorhamnose 3,5-epimerase|nr:dTDP-4-dehydrorhamnose 3,5-epimerase family protein [Candidatus Neomarinimicrobiota bacterium]MDP6569069.1 dTDP-4-dehydrorhamnose 3,5-epimerase family protein [Candidatus Neomarinimicrobiota bacterium]MDP7026430.1 dTDP-4-dehydrorhamnose 3,5-epimerase family protein [Candidatus Neomarinimicrobiota bacterium]